MMYLFDTDTLSNITKRVPSPRLMGRLAELPGAVQFTSAINIGEIYFGAHRSPHKERILRAFSENVFPHVNVLDFDRGSGEVYGLLKADLEKKGIGCSEPDLRIASIAIQHRLTLVSGNTRHFQNIPGLDVENWI